MATNMWWNTFADTVPTGQTSCTGNCDQGDTCSCALPQKHASGWVSLAVMVVSAALVVVPCALIWWSSR